jgi:hypothetical protein
MSRQGTDSARAIRLFIQDISRYFQKYCGAPHDNEVADLAEIAFDVNEALARDDIINARKPARRPS